MGYQKSGLFDVFGPPGPYGAKWGPESGKRCSGVPTNLDFGAWMRSNIPSGVYFNMAKMQACHLLDWGEILRWESLPRPKRIDRATLGRLGKHKNGSEWGHRGSPRAHIKPGRSYRLQEAF